MLKKLVLLVSGVLLLISLLGSTAAGQGTGLTAGYATTPPTLDGDGGDAAWAEAAEHVVSVSGGKIGSVDVTLKALYDGKDLFVLAQWPDSSLSIDKNLWEFDGSAWSKSGNEDRIAFLWNMGIAGFEEQGCLVACHTDGMRTNADGELADEWHWKAARSNPIGYSDDKYLDNSFVEGDVEAGHHGDGGDSTYADNNNEAGDGPAKTWTDPAAPAVPPYASADQAGSFLLRDDAVNLVAAAAGDKVPGYLLREPSGSRGDVKTVGTWANGMWTVEFQRSLNTGDNATKDGTPVDVVFDTAKTYLFGVAVMDDAGSSHSTNAGVVALDFAAPPAGLPVTGGVPGALVQTAIVAGGLAALSLAASLRKR